MKYIKTLTEMEEVGSKINHIKFNEDVLCIHTDRGVIIFNLDCQGEYDECIDGFETYVRREPTVCISDRHLGVDSGGNRVFTVSFGSAEELGVISEDEATELYEKEEKEYDKRIKDRELTNLSYEEENLLRRLKQVQEKRRYFDSLSSEGGVR